MRETARERERERETRTGARIASVFPLGVSARAAPPGKDVPLCQFEIMFSLQRREQADFVNPAEPALLARNAGDSHRLAANCDGASSRGETLINIARDVSPSPSPRRTGFSRGCVA